MTEQTDPPVNIQLEEHSKKPIESSDSFPTKISDEEDKESTANETRQESGVQRFLTWTVGWSKIDPNLRGVFITVLVAAIYTIIAVTVQGCQANIIEENRTRTDLVISAIQTNDREHATRNLDFFVASKLLDDKHGDIATALAEYGAPYLYFPTGIAQFEALRNGGFESDVEWEFHSEGLPIVYSSEAQHNGKRSLLMRSTTSAGYNMILQYLEIPSDVTSAFLEFWHLSFSSLEYGGYQEAFLLDEERNVVKILWRVNRNDQLWMVEQFDLTEFVGQNLYLGFGIRAAYENKETIAMYLDDVSVTITKTAGK